MLGLVGARQPSGCSAAARPPTSEAEREAAGERYGNSLFLPILIVLSTAVVGTLLYLYTPLHQSGLFERNRETFILLCLGVLLALAADLRLAAAAGRWRRSRRGGG